MINPSYYPLLYPFAGFLLTVILLRLFRRYEWSTRSDLNLPELKAPLDHPNYDYDYGLRLMAVQDYYLASAAFQWALDDRPNWPEPRFYLAVAYALQKEYDKAWGQYEILKEIDPDLAWKLFTYIQHPEEKKPRVQLPR